jgi:hypothetical protein
MLTLCLVQMGGTLTESVQMDDTRQKCADVDWQRLRRNSPCEVCVRGGGGGGGGLGVTPF